MRLVTGFNGVVVADYGYMSQYLRSIRNIHWVIAPDYGYMSQWEAFIRKVIGDSY